MAHPNDVRRDRVATDAKLYIEEVLQGEVDARAGSPRHRPILTASMRSALSDTELDQVIELTGRTGRRMIERPWATAIERVRIVRTGDGTPKRDSRGELLYDRWRHLSDFLTVDDRLNHDALRAYLARTAAAKVRDVVAQVQGCRSWDELELAAVERRERRELEARRRRRAVLDAALDATIARILAWADDQPWITRPEHREILAGQLSGRGHAELAKALGTPGPAGANRVLKKFRRGIEPHLPREARQAIELARRRAREPDGPSRRAD
jgi:hypothetical protein